MIATFVPETATRCASPAVRKSAWTSGIIADVSPITGQIHFDVFEGSMNATRFVEFCAKLVHDCPTPVFLIVDGSSAHTAQIVKEYVASTSGQLSLFFCHPTRQSLTPTNGYGKTLNTTPSAARWP
jgi:hypothetical protein